MCRIGSGRCGHNAGAIDRWEWEFGLRSELGWSLLWLGCVAVAQEEYSVAQSFLYESFAIFRGIGDPSGASLALASMAYVARASIDRHLARPFLIRAMREAIGIHGAMTVGIALTGVALAVADQGESERVFELFVLVSRYLYVANSRWFEDVAGQHIAAVAATLPLDVVSAAQEWGKAPDLRAMAEELLEEWQD